MIAKDVDVLVCGSLHLDTVVRGRLPAPDETVMGESVSYACGGKGGNQAVAAARVGARTAMIGRVGNDDAGRTLLANLREAGVDTAHVATGPEPSGMSVAIVQPDGEYGAVVVTGANASVEVGEVPAAKVLVLQNEVPEAVNLAVATRARKAGTFVVWNAAPMREGTGLDGLVDLLVVNRVEASQMFGVVVETPEQAVEVLEGGRSPVALACITLGAGGAVVGARGKAVHVPAPAVEIASTHGAGDAFVGVLAAEVARGAEAFDAVRVAVEAAARFVSSRRG